MRRLDFKWGRLKFLVIDFLIIIDNCFLFFLHIIILFESITKKINLKQQNSVHNYTAFATV